jgi:hypothetical protein
MSIAEKTQLKSRPRLGYLCGSRRTFGEGVASCGCPVVVEDVDQADDVGHLRGVDPARRVETGKQMIGTVGPADAHRAEGLQLGRCPNAGSVPERQMNFVARPILGEVCAGYLLLDDELHRGIRRVLGQVAKMDEIEHAVDFIELVLIVGSSEYRSGREFAIAKVFGKQTVWILGKPFERMPNPGISRSSDAAHTTKSPCASWSARLIE